MGLPLALFVLLLTGHPGPPRATEAAAPGAVAVVPDVLPPILWQAPEEIDAAWRKARKVVGDGARLVDIAKRGLHRRVCPGLVDLQDPRLGLVPDSGLAWKDLVRGRGWARPALARVLATAHAAWRVDHPTLALSVGDVSQAGCGQIDPGVLTRLVSGSEATALKAAARPIAGRPVVREVARAGSLADAPGRFVDPDAEVLIERELVAEGTPPGGDEPVLLMHVRRYLAAPAPTPGELAALARDVRVLVGEGEVALETRVKDGGGPTLYRRHIVDSARDRHAVIVSGLRGRRFRLDDTSDIRIGPWLPGRPGVFQGEARWIATRTDEGVSWAAWQLIEEGAHATHMAGRDADLSYAHGDPRLRFIEAIDAVDLPATWAWFVALEEAGRELGTPIDSIIVGPRIYRKLLAAIPGARSSKLVTDRILRVVRAHDDHQHVRIAEPSAAADAEASSALRSNVHDTSGSP